MSLYLETGSLGANQFEEVIRVGSCSDRTVALKEEAERIFSLFLPCKDMVRRQLSASQEEIWDFQPLEL